MKEKAPISVVVGKLVNPSQIETEEGDYVPVKEWEDRAKWSYLRLVKGRKIDDTIKLHHEAGDTEIMNRLLWDSVQDRPLQFIMSADNEVVAVATMKHLLIPPDTVYTTAYRAVYSATNKAIFVSVEEPRLQGRVIYLDGFAGIKTGVQIDGGDLTTRFAIRVGVFARVEMCFNPLSWLGVSGLGRFAIPSDYERVLRIQKLNELFPRLQASIANAKDKLGDLEKRVNHSKGVSVSSPTALTLTGAMGMAYGLGAKTIRQVLDRFKEEDKTQYGLAMAQSWTAQHGKHRRTPEAQTTRVPQSLSTISGATLLIDDVKTAEAKCKKWLGDQKSKLAEDLLAGRLP
jgi:hypothetical protein